MHFYCRATTWTAPVGRCLAAVASRPQTGPVRSAQCGRRALHVMLAAIVERVPVLSPLGCVRAAILAIQLELLGLVLRLA
ncbi:uncharacterized protein B0I36DRAFT_84646 [Microdochium trichocladiopsis]|uniref:Uncharacterized protein n=1 Tax=Microdochium trichocladiopsis TaxID=1682393 RepID=A0A9P8YBD2_9PEZI|nr:uncharacterized protein B0I36DRAFT_84646 [Microdochium trichocladiopsis]KAH7034840.1 hypothetical protein B0I36DRAFT_84646 [Microdochium trichocladiopsis]